MARSFARATSRISKWALWSAALMLVPMGAWCASDQASAAPLPALGADLTQTSVSGLSSGAFMAVQLQVAYSRRIVGAGVVAGGPYYCAANNMFYTGICMGQVPFMPPNPSIMAGFARDHAQARKIDPLKYLAQRRIYVFSGTQDSIVRQPAVDATVAFFEEVGVKPANLRYENQVPAGHAVITPSDGNDCSANKAPYISHCTVGNSGYDQAQAILSHIYGPLKPMAPSSNGQLLPFNQRRYAPASTAMADTAYVYVPAACTSAGTHCKVHVALHGCAQSVDTPDVGLQFVKEVGYNAWADTNELIVLYPQVNKSRKPSNPAGCWDWWGYTGSKYAQRAAPQQKAIMAMVQRLGNRPVVPLAPASMPAVAPATP
jgi:Esterase PHB depolymerase